MAGHSMRASLVKMDAATIAALRKDRDIADPRLAALAAFTRQMVRERGHVSDAEIEGFLAAGYTPQNVLRSEEHTSELQSLMRISYAVFCLKKKKQDDKIQNRLNEHNKTKVQI